MLVPNLPLGNQRNRNIIMERKTRYLLVSLLLLLLTALCSIIIFNNRSSFELDQANIYLTNICKKKTKAPASHARIVFNDFQYINANEWVCEYLPIKNVKFIPDNSGIEIYASDIFENKLGKKCQFIIYFDRSFFSSKYEIELYCTEKNSCYEFFFN